MTDSDQREILLNGIGVSPGICIGKACHNDARSDNPTGIRYNGCNIISLVIKNKAVRPFCLHLTLLFENDSIEFLFLLLFNKGANFENFMIY